MFWAQLGLWVLTTALSYLLAPKPEKPKPAALEDFDVPTVDQDRDMEVIFGTVWDDDPNIVWYGDLRAVPIKKKGGKK